MDNSVYRKEKKMNIDLDKLKPARPNRVYDIEACGIKGQVCDYGMAIKLEFDYEGKKHEIGLSRGLDDDLEQTGTKVMETVISRLLGKGSQPRLYNWYISGDDKQAHGNVKGNPKIMDTTFIHTSTVNGVEIDFLGEEALIATRHTLYHAPLAHCDIDTQAQFPDMLPEFDKIKEKYSEGKIADPRLFAEKERKIVFPTIEQGKVLLVLSDFDEYYFHSLCVIGEDGEPLRYSAHAHIGTFQDSFLIQTDDEKCMIDLRYFPHYGNIEFYASATNGMPLYAENIGESTLYIELHKMMFSLKGGERKELCEQNACEDIDGLPNGDLYPAQFLDDEIK